MKTLMNYAADKGSVVINGIYFNNGIGDGVYSVIFADKRPENIQAAAWVDFRDCKNITIWCSDCDSSTSYTFDRWAFDRANAIEFGFDKSGNLVIWKMF